ncbi:MAG: type II toxin-antitoxin system HicB family antitoxin [Pirellulales bacterium]
MNYPVVIHKDPESDYGVTVPDLSGCFSAGETLDEAVEAAREAIELHLEGLVAEGQPIPRPGTIEQHQRRRQYRGGTWAVVPIDPNSLRIKTRPINVSVPERTLATIDRFAERHGWSRSALMVSATCEFIEKSTDPGDPPIGKRRVKRSSKAKR